MSKDLEAVRTALENATGSYFHEVVKFPNGRGVSIIADGGRQENLKVERFEVAVVDASGELDYSTPITDDVIRWQSVADVVDVMRQVAELPAALESR